MGFKQVFLVHAVPGDGDLTDVVKQVLDENLQGGHRFEGEPGAGNEDGKDIAKVGGGDHFDILDCIAVGDTASSHAINDDAEGFFGKNDVGALFSDVGACVDRDTNIGESKSDAVVDAVAEEADTFAHGF